MLAFTNHDRLPEFLDWLLEFRGSYKSDMSLQLNSSNGERINSGRWSVPVERVRFGTLNDIILLIISTYVIYIMYFTGYLNQILVTGVESVKFALPTGSLRRQIFSGVPDVGSSTGMVTEIALQFP
jgi:hypothetical protein